MKLDLLKEVVEFLSYIYHQGWKLVEVLTGQLYLAWFQQQERQQEAEVQEDLVLLLVINYSLKIKPELKVDSGKGKVILRNLLYQYLPKEMMERPKMGFAV